ncbi:TIGR01212 family radical SAM protein [Ferrimonas balearica]|uniref:TIGR01212 family radical SAM protein n=1 Tax=Ferrimonas balearica TaxID=44012 RepID=UPI001C996E05|nr:TIGR01212 family radical SAM protein [Ferrimonas balearica]MBY5922936.1 TIGR01212 family radical SAM protein [Ferrimonas balearica]MBY5997687.1 TIGR01212 family radical SAM protein [Ferrimonas balearica]
MGLNRYVHTLGHYMTTRYGQKIHKLTIDAAFTCPNRDGSLGVGGCTFCNVSSFSAEHGTQASVAEQLVEGRARREGGKVRPDKRYLAYFQAYTSTYDEYAVLKRKYEEALAVSDIVGICVGTRPDCVPEEVLALLAGYQQQGMEVWLELGLQSAHDETLKKINRGHDFTAYADTVARARLYGLKVCTHLILGLPGEMPEHAERTLQRVLEVGTDGLKLHPLHVVEGSIMAKQWRAGRLELWDQDTYMDCAASLIRQTPPEVVYHRVSAYARPPELIAPDWCGDKWLVMNGLIERLKRDGGQGTALNRAFQPQV